MIILGLFIMMMLGLLMMAMLDMLVFQQPFSRAIVHLLPVYPDTSTIFMFIGAFAIAAWINFRISERLKKRFGSKPKNQGGEKRDAKQS
ncbi:MULTISPECIES: hypothetical protein [unclassified Paenibacillus]|uniref:hypothetical protein n=1 Tax=unclassified Paenibacillus TaxID=185978 RepID=UPI00104CA63D|nr:MULTISPECIES: hypothetical protein [unclassified Paenibacillus]NIK71563.1 hypothetical protein [Paenibacillus sp. BK720]TCM96212.1 hypothetical protein EV294_10575 [Paenibacillus sp. BK033]